jgi:L-iditol 2-dehydrogenase
MLRAKLLKPGIFKLDECDIPKISEDEILIKVIYAGVCGTDIHSYKGENRFIKSYPIILGHEFVGKIFSVGRNISRFSVGQIVTAEPIITCNKCEYCKRGDYNLCTNLIYMEGAFSEYVVEREQNTFHVPKSIRLENAIFIEPLAVAIHSIKMAGIKKGLSILVLGAGTIGQLIIQLARLYGAGYIIVLARSKLEFAKKNGANQTLNIDIYSELSEILKIIEKDSIDVVFDCISNSFSISISLEIIKKGGKIIIIGLSKSESTIDLLRVMIKELKIFGSSLYRKNFPEAIRMIKNNQIKLDGFISKVFNFKNINNAFKKIIKEQNKNIKCIVKL